MPSDESQTGGSREASATRTPRSELDQMMKGSGECAICGETAQDTVFMYTMEDYMGTNLDEKPPVRALYLCAHHYDEILPETKVVDQQEVPGLAD